MGFKMLVGLLYVTCVNLCLRAHALPQGSACATGVQVGFGTILLTRLWANVDPCPLLGQQYERVLMGMYEFIRSNERLQAKLDVLAVGAAP